MIDPRKISARRINSMLLHMTAEDVADHLEIPLDTVLRAADASRLRMVVLHCHDTGRLWRCRGERAAYLRVCLAGLTDWSAQFEVAT